ncbi:MAG TPA: sigma-70 region 4 domain-containing protein [Chloroflexota bacterium]
MATSEAPRDNLIEPLTHCNLQGAPYERLRKVEQQIQAALALSADDLVARARIDDRAYADYLQEEALAYFIRRAHRSADDDLANDLSGILVKRCTLVLKIQLRALRQDLLEEAIAETIADLFELLVEPEGSDRGDFLQVRFWVAVRPLRIAAFNRAVKQSDRELLMVAIDPTGAGGDDGEEQGLEVSDPRAPAPDVQLLTDEALARLEPNIRQAFVMRLEGWPVEDRDPSVPTISRHFGRTSRTIRNWLTQAEEQLAAWREEEANS